MRSESKSGRNHPHTCTHQFTLLIYCPASNAMSWHGRLAGAKSLTVPLYLSHSSTPLLYPSLSHCLSLYFSFASLTASLALSSFLFHLYLPGTLWGCSLAEAKDGFLLHKVLERCERQKRIKAVPRVPFLSLALSVPSVWEQGTSPPANAFNMPVRPLSCYGSVAKLEILIVERQEAAGYTYTNHS